MSEAIKGIVGEELYTQIVSKLGDKKIDVISDNYIPKSRFDELVGQKNLVKTQADELGQQLETLKKASKGNEELTKTIEQLQKQNGDWEGKYKSTLLESAIKIKAMSEKAKDPSDLLKFLDASKLEITETGEVKGLEEQLKTLKESKAYLFDVAGGTPPPNPAGGGGNTKTDEQTLKDGYTEAIKNGNNALAISLKNKLFDMQNKK